MPLPAGGQGLTWPPKSEADVGTLYREHAAWYSGDPEKLAAFYSGSQVFPARPGTLAVGRSPWWRSWGRANSAQYAIQQRAQLHIPLAGEMAASSAALLFTELPDLTIAEAQTTRGPIPADGGEGPIVLAPSEAVLAQDRLEELLVEGGVHARLLEAAETAAAMGGVYLKPAWDEKLADHPILAVQQVDMGIPEFSWGLLRAVTLWRELKTDGRVVLRHLERHERAPDGTALILHGLYRGTAGELGERLSDVQLMAETGLEPVVVLPFKGLGIRYVPNMRPNRRWRQSFLGQSDYAGAEGMLDALDETWASWMRDIRLGKARIMVPEDFLLPDRRFDVDHEVFTGLDMQPSSAQNQITSQQFEIRVEQHLGTALALLERIVSNAGWSPQTFGLNIAGRAESGVALRVRESKTYFTRQRKAGWFSVAVGDVAEMLLAIDRTIFKRTEHGVYRPSAELPEGTATPGELAQTLTALRSAEAASTETLVRMLHPEWSDDQVDAEVSRINEERGTSVPNPGGFGVTDMAAVDMPESPFGAPPMPDQGPPPPPA